MGFGSVGSLTRKPQASGRHKPRGLRQLGRSLFTFDSIFRTPEKAEHQQPF